MSDWRINTADWKLCHWIFFVGLSLFAWGISWSVFLVSNSVIILSLLIPFIHTGSKFVPSLNSTWKVDLGKVFKEPLLLSMILFFSAHVMSIYWSDQLKDWIWFSRMMLPFLLLPFVFLLHPYLNNWIIRWVLFIFILSCFGSSIFILADYFRHSETYNLQLLKGKPFVTHISHIRYSMMIAISSLICLHAFFIGNSKSKINNAAIFILFLYFFAFNHLLSAKTGLIAMYMALFAYILFGIPKWNWKSKFITLALLIVVMLMCFQIFPSLQQKFYYSWWQIGEFSRGKWLNYSDIERWVSIVMGIEMIKQETFFGFGMGDLNTATANVYQECLNHPDFKLPHNQFIFTWAFTGIFGLLSLLSIIWHSAFQKAWFQHPLVFSVQLILLTSFLVEYTLGTQIGCSLYVFGTLISWAWIRSLKREAESGKLKAGSEKLKA